MSVEDRLSELEVKLSFTEDLVDALNTTVYRQQKEIDDLRLQLHALRQQLLASQPAEQHALRDEIPPHY